MSVAIFVTIGAGLASSGATSRRIAEAHVTSSVVSAARVRTTGEGVGTIEMIDVTTKAAAVMIDATTRAGAVMTDGAHAMTGSSRAIAEGDAARVMTAVSAAMTAPKNELFRRVWNDAQTNHRCLR